MARAMLRIGREGVKGTATPAELSRLRGRFARRHFIRLPGFVEPELIAFVQEKLKDARFKEFRKGSDVRQKPADPATGVFLWMLFSDRRLHEFVEVVTGEGPVGSVTGGVFRMIPGAPHRLDWHQDLKHAQGRRFAAMTVNLSPKPVRGGLLQLRLKPRRRPLGEVAYTRAGDAVLFRLRGDIEHRSTELGGTREKTIYSGWFHRRP